MLALCARVWQLAAGKLWRLLTWEFDNRSTIKQKLFPPTDMDKMQMVFELLLTEVYHYSKWKPIKNCRVITFYAFVPCNQTRRCSVKTLLDLVFQVGKIRKLVLLCFQTLHCIFYMALNLVILSLSNGRLKIRIADEDFLRRKYLWNVLKSTCPTQVFLHASFLFLRGISKVVQKSKDIIFSIKQLAISYFIPLHCNAN